MPDLKNRQRPIENFRMSIERREMLSSRIECGAQPLRTYYQGHSMNPPGHGLAGFGAVFAEVFPGFGDGEAAFSDQGQGGRRREGGDRGKGG